MLISQIGLKATLESSERKMIATKIKNETLLSLPSPFSTKPNNYLLINTSDNSVQLLVYISTWQINVVLSNP